MMLSSAQLRRGRRQVTPWHAAYRGCTVSKATDCATSAVHNALITVLRLLDERGMTRSKPAMQAGISLAPLLDMAHDRAGPFSTVLEAIRQALHAPLMPFETISPGGAVLDPPDASGIPCEPPPGFVRVSVLLTEQQAIYATQWDQANRKRCATKACELLGTPPREQHSLDG